MKNKTITIIGMVIVLPLIIIFIAGGFSSVDGSQNNTNTSIEKNADTSQSFSNTTSLHKIYQDKCNDIATQMKDAEYSKNANDPRMKEHVYAITINGHYNDKDEKCYFTAKTWIDGKPIGEIFSDAWYKNTIMMCGSMVAYALNDPSKSNNCIVDNNDIGGWGDDGYKKIFYRYMVD
jgi:hypothetical protein